MNVIAEYLQYDFFQRVILACLVVGTVCALLSTYVVLRRLVFASIALTQLSSAGLGIAALAAGVGTTTGILARYLLPLPTALATTLIGVAILSLVQPTRKGRTDNLIALLYVGGWAVSILLFAVAERGDTEMAHILYGDILGVLLPDILHFLPVAIVVSALVIWLGKELLFCSFDPETAATCRVPVWLYDLIFYTMLALVIVFAVKMLGLMLVFAYLVAPGTAALLYCKRMPAALVFSVLFAAVMSLSGLALAAVYDLPPGPAVTATGVLLLLLVAAVRQVAELASARQGVRLRGIRRTQMTTAAIVVVLVVATVLTGRLISVIGAGATTEHLKAHGFAPRGSEAGKAARPAGPVHAPGVKYAPSVGDELPDTSQLLGESAHDPAKEAMPNATEASPSTDDRNAQH